MELTQLINSSAYISIISVDIVCKRLQISSISASETHRPDRFSKKILHFKFFRSGAELQVFQYHYGEEVARQSDMAVIAHCQLVALV
jgi:hypothetical protein